MAKILIVDDEIGIRELLSEILDEEGYTVYAAENAEAARVLMSQEQFDLILLDIWMPDTDGITLLKEWGVRKMLNCPVIMMSGHGTIETAVEATKFGALAFLEKPISMQKLLAQEAIIDRIHQNTLKTFSYISPYWLHYHSNLHRTYYYNHEGDMVYKYLLSQKYKKGEAEIFNLSLFKFI